MSYVIDSITIYPQIFVYKKAYLDALIAGTTEPDVIGHWAAVVESSAGSWTLVGGDLNPFNYDAKTQSVDLSISGGTQAQINITDANMYTILARLDEMVSPRYYEVTPDTSLYWCVVTKSAVDYVIPYVDAGELAEEYTRVPMHIRHFMVVVYHDNALENPPALTALFPNAANTSYETVLNASAKTRLLPERDKEYPQTTVYLYNEDFAPITIMAAEATITKVPVYVRVDYSIVGSPTTEWMDDGSMVLGARFGNAELTAEQLMPAGITGTYPEWTLVSANPLAVNPTVYHLDASYVKTKIYKIAGAFSTATLLQPYIIHEYVTYDMSDPLSKVTITPNIALPTISMTGGLNNIAYLYDNYSASVTVTAPVTITDCSVKTRIWEYAIKDSTGWTYAIFDEASAVEYDAQTDASISSGTTQAFAVLFTMATLKTKLGHANTITAAFLRLDLTLTYTIGIDDPVTITNLVPVYLSLGVNNMGISISEFYPTIEGDLWTKTQVTLSIPIPIASSGTTLIGQTLNPKLLIKGTSISMQKGALGVQKTPSMAQSYTSDYEFTRISAATKMRSPTMLHVQSPHMLSGSDWIGKVTLHDVSNNPIYMEKAGIMVAVTGAPLSMISWPSGGEMDNGDDIIIGVT